MGFIPIGEHRVKGKEIEFKICPMCNNQRWNMSVSVEKGIYHCWACNAAGKVAGMSVLFKGEFKAEGDLTKSVLSIPETAVPIWASEDGKIYVESRGVPINEVHALGVLWDNGRLLVPCYESGEKLIALNVRTKEGQWIFNGDSRENVFYTIPGKTNKLVICEGFFDGVKLARLGHTVLILFGRVLYGKQRIKAVQHYDNIVLALDMDKPGLTATHSIAEQLLKIEGVTVYRALMPEGRKDFGECNAIEIEESFKNLETMSFASLLRLRLTKNDYSSK